MVALTKDTCSIASDAESVLEENVIESRSHFNAQLPQLCLHRRDAPLIGLPVQTVIFPDRNIDEVVFAVRLDAFVELSADKLFLLGNISLTSCHHFTNSSSLAFGTENTLIKVTAMTHLL